MSGLPLLWAVATALVMLVALLLSGEWLVRASIPALHSMFEWIAPDFQLQRLELQRDKADQVLRAWVTLGRYTFVGAQLITPDPRGMAQASTLAVHGLQGPLLALWAAVAWPAAAVRTRLLRLLVCLPAAALMFLLDAPVVLAASIWQFLVDAHAPGSWQPLLIARDLLQGGGRFVIGLAIGAGCAIAVSGTVGIRLARGPVAPAE
ncbi:MAG: hypothetical protein QE285_17825 [Aquabacterium sp.]|nr:hypothetical protein [Aquabacterium sp.]